MSRTFDALAARLLIAGTMCLALDSSAARASDGDGNTMQLRVHTSDLNLASPADQQTLRHRVRSAARKVCAKLGFSESLDANTFLVCYTDAVHAALSVADERIAAARSSTRLAEGAVRTGQ